MLSTILIIGLIAAILLIVIVLIQNPKGGGLASNFSSSTQIFGAQRTSEGVEKLTWIFASILLLVSLFASSQNGVSNSKSEGFENSKNRDAIEAQAPKSTTRPVQPANEQPPMDPTRATNTPGQAAPETK